MLVQKYRSRKILPLLFTKIAFTSLSTQKSDVEKFSINPLPISILSKSAQSVSNLLTQNVLSSGNGSLGWIRFNLQSLNLSILYDGCVSLTSVCAEEGSSFELEVECAGELSGWVGEEADAGFAELGGEDFGPAVHAVGDVLACCFVGGLRIEGRGGEIDWNLERGFE